MERLITGVSNPGDKGEKFGDRKFFHILSRSYCAVYIYRMIFSKMFISICRQTDIVTTVLSPV